MAQQRTHYIAKLLKEFSEHPEGLDFRREAHAYARARVTFRLRAYAGIAASMLILAGFAAYSAGWSLPRLLWEKPTEKQYATAVGQRSSVVLDDGSRLTLDTDTFVRVTFGRERSILLERGQALFDVAKGDKRPFVVKAMDRRVIATGTSFDVRVTNKVIAVVLIEGKVTVDQTVRRFGKDQVVSSSQLRPGEQLNALAGGAASIGQVTLDTVTGWTSGKHIFRRTRLDEAIAEVNRYTDTPIILGDDSLGAIQVSGVYSTGRPMDFATMVGQLNELSIEQRANGEILIGKKIK
jgi:transmembrane sensor